MPSVLIPAHDEEALIQECLAAVLQDKVENLEVIVVANACSDRTAELARQAGAAVQVIETETPGKTAALNRGDKLLHSFPRLYLDGDIVLSPGSVRALFAACRDKGTEIASPMPAFDGSGSSLPVRLFYGALRYNSYFGQGAPNGSGSFALSQDGRERWDEFPDIIADDEFVRRHFAARESRSISSTSARVALPRNFRTLLAVQSRTRQGTQEVNAEYPGLTNDLSGSGLGMLKRMLIRPWTWPALAIFLTVRVVERSRAAKARRSGTRTWHRDESSRDKRAHDQAGNG